MENGRFDALARSLAQDTSRRKVLQGVASSGLAGLLATIGVGSIGVDDTEAANCRRRCRRRQTAKARRRCRRRCAGGGTGTSPTPISTNTSPSAGAVGTSCTTASECLFGLTCPDAAGGRVCTETKMACSDVCSSGTQCCTVGTCDRENGITICV
jgi:hypothetical protein